MKEWFDIRITEDPDFAQPNFNGRTVTVHKTVLERIIQEEIWAQTVWPPGVKSLSELLAEVSK